jgi:hypothetical protein
MPQGTVAQNIFHYVVGSINDPDSENVANDFLGRFLSMWNHVVGQIDPGMIGNSQEMYVRDVPNNEWTLTETDDLSVIQGGSGSQMLPHGNAALVSALSTNNRTSGRKYLSGFVEDAQVDGVWDPAALADLVLWAAGYADPFTGSSATYVPGLWSVKANEFVPFIGGASINAIVAYQRRRKVGVGI